MSQQFYKNPFVINLITGRIGSQTGLARRCGGLVKQDHNRRPLRTSQRTAEVCAALECGSAGALTKTRMRPDLFVKAVEIGGRGRLRAVAEGGVSMPLPLQMGAMP